MTLLSCISAEKTIRLPLRSCIGIRHRNKQLADDFLVERRRLQIHWLIVIVRWGVVAVSQPIFKCLLLRRSRVETNVHDQSWNSVTNEVVLIAADKQIPQRLGIRQQRAARTVIHSAVVNAISINWLTDANVVYVRG